MDDSRVDFANHVHSYLGEFIRAADQKAAFLLVASTALLGWLVPSKNFVLIDNIDLAGLTL